MLWIPGRVLLGDGIGVKGKKGEGDNGEGEAFEVASVPSSAVQPSFSVLQL